MPRRKNASPRAKTASADQLQQTSLRSFFPPIEGAAEKGGTKAGGAAKKEAGGAAKKRGKEEVGETSLTQCVPKQKTFRWAGVDTGMSEREFFAYNPPKTEEKDEKTIEVAALDQSGKREGKSDGSVDEDVVEVEVSSDDVSVSAIGEPSDGFRFLCLSDPGDAMEIGDDECDDDELEAFLDELEDETQEACRESPEKVQESQESAGSQVPEGNSIEVTTSGTSQGSPPQDCPEDSEDLVCALMAAGSIGDGAEVDDKALMAAGSTDNGTEADDKDETRSNPLCVLHTMRFFHQCFYPPRERVGESECYK